MHSVLLPFVVYAASGPRSPPRLMSKAPQGVGLQLCTLSPLHPFQNWRLGGPSGTLPCASSLHALRIPGSDLSCILLLERDREMPREREVRVHVITPPLPCGQRSLQLCGSPPLVFLLLCSSSALFPPARPRVQRAHGRPQPSDVTRAARPDRNASWNKPSWNKPREVTRAAAACRKEGGREQCLPVPLADGWGA